MSKQALTPTPTDGSNIAPAIGAGVAAGSPFPGIERPEQILDLVQNPIVKEFIFLMAAGQGLVKADSHPEWVVCAARELWLTCFDFPKTRRAKSENYRMGFIAGITSRIRPDWFAGEAGLAQLLGNGTLTQFFHAMVRDAPLADAVDFYAGFADGVLRSGNITPRSPCLVYAIMAIVWQQAAQCKNVRELHAWLSSILGQNLTGSSDRLAKLCQKIRFPFTDKGGRPKSKPRKPARS